MTRTTGDRQAEVWGRNCPAFWESPALGKLALMLLAGIMAVIQAGAGEPSQEVQSKTKFLLNFAEFAEWPDAVFADKEQVFKIGVLGRDPFGKQLDKLAETERLKGRRARIFRSRRVDDLKSCNILYIGQTDEARLERILRTLKEKPVLTVSEIENSANNGVMIQMKTEAEKVRLVINLEAAKAANVTLKSKLLRLGEIVEPGKK